MKKKLLLLTIAVLCLGTFASADNYSAFGNRAAQNATDIIDWTQLGPDFSISGTTIPTPALVASFAGNLALVGNINGGDFVRVDQGLSWNGNFDFGESLVWTGNSNFGGGGGGPFLIEMANPVQSIGIGIMADLFGPFTATVVVYDASLSPVALFNFFGTSTSSNAGDNLFMGIADNSGVNIGAVVISTTSAGDTGGTFVNDFALDDPSFGYGPIIPEPSTLVLLGSGLLGLAGMVRHKRKS